MILSNFLWRLRNKIGEQKMSEILFDLAGQLNSHNDPKKQGQQEGYGSVYLSHGRSVKNKRRIMISNMRFNEVIKESTERFSLDYDDIVTLSKNLINREDKMLRDGSGYIETTGGYIRTSLASAIELDILFDMIF